MTEGEKLSRWIQCEAAQAKALLDVLDEFDRLDRFVFTPKAPPSPEILAMRHELASIIEAQREKGAA